MVVRMRATRSHRNNRRSHHALAKPALTVDTNTGTVHLRHRASAITGKYKGITVIDMEKKAVKKARKMKEAQAAR
ncbi:MAG: 50S ribosomal protein L32 [Patescibacteria group bacterium]|nr:50S ribosomal protein L32 [Patescibacteria group bacterium]MDE2116448.1 50S ribosomal protein L32 [Patescibacteria group bacterium]